MTGTPNMVAVTRDFEAWAGGFFAAAHNGRVDREGAYARTLQFADELLDAAEADDAGIEAGLLAKLEALLDEFCKQETPAHG